VSCTLRQIILFIFHLNDFGWRQKYYLKGIGSWCLHAIISEQSAITTLLTNREVIKKIIIIAISPVSHTKIYNIYMIGIRYNMYFIFTCIL